MVKELGAEQFERDELASSTSVGAAISRRAALGLAVTAAASAAGCTNNRRRVPTEIVYWTGWSGHELDVQRSLISQFNRLHPHIRVVMLSQFGNSGYEKVRIAFAGGSTPDIMSTVWADELAAYAMRDVLLPLDEYLKSAHRDITTEYMPGIARMVTIGDRVYGLTVSSSTNFIAYNQRIFSQSGLNPAQPPMTTDQLDVAARKCTKFDANGNFKRYGFRPSDLSMWVYPFGGGWYNDLTGEITANSPQNVAALQWMASYAQQYNMRKMQAFSTTFGSSSTPNGPFYVGKTAMEVTGEWERAFVDRYSPQLEWGWFALPHPPGGRPNSTTLDGSIFVIPAACKHREEAWEFLNWMTSHDAVKTFCWSIRNVPPLLSVSRDPLFQTDPLFHFTIPIQEGPAAFGPPALATWTMLKTAIGRAEDAVMLGGEVPAVVLSRLQEEAVRQLRRTMEELRS